MPNDSRRLTSEDAFIETLLAPLASEAAEALGLRDDVACVSPRPGYDQIWTADTLVAGVHFFADDAPQSIARKALAVNVSDVASKGGRPVHYLMMLALPESVSEDWLVEFCAGLQSAQAQWGCCLVGGDTVRTPGPLTVSITLIGEVPHGRMVPRTGARPGQMLLVTGSIGDAYLGLRLRQDAGLQRVWGLDDGAVAYLRGRYLEPVPRLEFGEALMANATAAMDISDGLVLDLRRLCRASGCGARLDLAKIPLSDAARIALTHSPDLLTSLATGGDDYELLIAAEPSKQECLMLTARDVGIALSEIGVMTESSKGVSILDEDGSEIEIEQGGYLHF